MKKIGSRVSLSALPYGWTIFNNINLFLLRGFLAVIDCFAVGSFFCSVSFCFLVVSVFLRVQMAKRYLSGNSWTEDSDQPGPSGVYTNSPAPGMATTPLLAFFLLWSS